MPPKILTPYYKRIFAGVRPSWQMVLRSDAIKPALKRAFDGLEAYLTAKGVTQAHVAKNGLDTYIRPGVDNILEAFRYFDVNNLVGIVMAQDPYPNPGDAMGLSFSVPDGAAIPASLGNIYKALAESALLEDRVGRGGNLTSWAKQGILMLNRYLTRSPKIYSNATGCWVDGNGNGDKDCLHTFWSDFTSTLIQYLLQEVLLRLNHADHYCGIMLWGTFANELATTVREITGDAEWKNRAAGKLTVELLTWGHPSPQSTANRDGNPASFKYCPHFKTVNNSLSTCIMEPIVWDPAVPVAEPANRLYDQFYYLRYRGMAIDLARKAYDDGTSTEENLQIRARIAAAEARRQAISPVTVAVNPIIVATDGGGLDPGKSTARGTYGAHFPSSWRGKPNGLGATNISGKVPPHTLVLNTAEMSLTAAGEPKLGTSQRGELLGFIHAILHVLREYYRTNIRRPVIVITDSEYLMHMVNERLWNYLAKDPGLSGTVRSNLDLVIIIKELLHRLIDAVPNAVLLANKVSIWHALMQPAARDHYRTKAPMVEGWPGLTIIHQNSHRTGGSEPEIVNRAVDALCTAAFDYDHHDPVVTAVSGDDL